MIGKNLPGRSASTLSAAPMAALLAALTARAVPAVAEPSCSGDPEPGIEDGTILTRASMLWTSAPWQQLKRLWWILDAAPPGPGGYGTVHPMESDSASRWRLDALLTLEELRAEAPTLGLDSLELEAIQQLVDHRIQLLCWGSMIPMTRMMPPPVNGQVDSILVLIEQRIDAIRELRGRNALDSAEMQAAFGSLAAAVEDYLLLGVVSRSTGYHGALYLATWPMEADRIRDAVDSARTAALDRIDVEGELYEGEEAETIESFDRVLADLDSMRTRLPALTELIRDLELFDPGSPAPRTDS